MRKKRRKNLRPSKPQTPTLLKTLTYFSKGNYQNARIRAQLGSFVIFGLENKEIIEDGKFKKIDRIIIPNRKKKEILEQLNVLGVNQYTVYCEKENLGKYISANLH